MLKVALALLPMEITQPTGPRGEVPKRTYFPDPASKIGMWHTADHILPPIGGLRGQLCSRLNRSLGPIGDTQAIFWTRAEPEVHSQLSHSPGCLKMHVQLQFNEQSIYIYLVSTHLWYIIRQDQTIQKHRETRGTTLEREASPKKITSLPLLSTTVHA